MKHIKIEFLSEGLDLIPRKDLGVGPRPKSTLSDFGHVAYQIIGN